MKAGYPETPQVCMHCQIKWVYSYQGRSQNLDLRMHFQGCIWSSPVFLGFSLNWQAAINEEMSGRDAENRRGPSTEPRGTPVDFT